MKIKNVKSFKHETEVVFKKGFNILIGPNGGGKSNLLDIITACLRKYVFFGYNYPKKIENDVAHREITTVDSFKQFNSVFPAFYGSTEPRELEITFSIAEPDIENIKTIVANEELIKSVFKQFRNYENYNTPEIATWDISKINVEDEIVLSIENESAVWKGDVEYTFLKDYITKLQLYAHLLKVGGNQDLKIPYIYFSALRGRLNPGQFRVTLSEQDPIEIATSTFNNTSKGQTSFVSTATSYFAGKYRRLQSEAESNGFLSLWEADTEVELIKNHLKILGYGWSLIEEDNMKNTYKISITKDGNPLNVNDVSAGENEILNFIIGLFALHIKDGIILIDEVETHLHPQLQILLLSLLKEISKLQNIQFIISTHSAHFITPETVGDIMRVYMGSENESIIKTFTDISSHNSHDLLHIVNAHNNSRMFFSDAVVLVEGLKDRLLFGRIFDIWSEVVGSKKIITCMEVHGKSNFSKYTKFLKNIGIEVFTIADLDYAVDLADSAEKQFLKNLLKVDYKAIDKNVLKNKKSKDLKTISAALEGAIKSGDKDTLLNIWEYVKARHTTLRNDISPEYIDKFHEIINRSRQDNVYILKNGDIEDYLPKDAKIIDGIINLTKPGTFENWLTENKDSNEINELMDITSEIMGTADKYDAFWSYVS